MGKFTLFTTMLCFSLGARALEIGGLPFSKLNLVKAEDRAAVLDHASKVLIEFEEKGGITYRQRGPTSTKDARVLCSKAGWIFFSAPGLPCDQREIHRGCEAGESRCASWTGREACVPSDGNALAACLKDRTKAEKKRADDFFFNDIQAYNWVDVWDAARLRCLASANASCAKLKTLADSAREIPEPFFGHDGFRGHPLGAEAEAKDPKTWVRAIFALLFPEAQCAVCGFDKKDNKFKKADGGEIAYEFGIHGSRGGTEPLVGETEKMNPEQLKNHIDQYLAGEQRGLADYKNQRERLRKAAENGKIEWVALEILPSKFKDADLDEYRKSAQNMTERMQNAGIPKEKIDDVILAAWGPYLTDAINNEPWTKKAKPVPVDSDELKKKGNQMLNTMDSIINTKLKPKLDDGKIPKATYDSMIALINKKLLSGNLTDKETRDLVTKFPSDSYLDVQMTMYQLASFLKSSNDRDAHVADQLQKQNGNGAIVMGSAHQEGITAILQKYCKSNGQTAPARGTGTR